MAGVRLAEFLRDAMGLPEVELRGEELVVHGKPFCYVSSDGESVRLKALLQEQAALIEHDPSAYGAAEVSGRYGWVAVRLDRVRRDELTELLDEAWSHSAPKKLIIARRKATG
ncbi:MAG TPA: MmcQ/YjbR family DNA-binding protein [Candidatus Limnocylindrales bacterium]|nr:MmcQ/YjbR family DNA-binding protein [Candidatus Limnocylindrales bacterium]